MLPNATYESIVKWEYKPTKGDLLWIKAFRFTHALTPTLWIGSGRDRYPYLLDHVVNHSYAQQEALRQKPLSFWNSVIRHHDESIERLSREFDEHIRFRARWSLKLESLERQFLEVIQKCVEERRSYLSDLIRQLILSDENIRSRDELEIGCVEVSQEQRVELEFFLNPELYFHETLRKEQIYRAITETNYSVRVPMNSIPVLDEPYEYEYYQCSYRGAVERLIREHGISYVQIAIDDKLILLRYVSEHIATLMRRYTESDFEFYALGELIRIIGFSTQNLLSFQQQIVVCDARIHI